MDFNSIKCLNQYKLKQVGYNIIIFNLLGLSKFLSLQKVPFHSIHCEWKRFNRTTEIAHFRYIGSSLNDLLALFINLTLHSDL